MFKKLSVVLLLAGVALSAPSGPLVERQTAPPPSTDCLTTAAESCVTNVLATIANPTAALACITALPACLGSNPTSILTTLLGLLPGGLPALPVDGL